MKKILTLLILVILLTGCNKTKSITCEATEKDEETKTTTKVISKYNYNSNGTKINSIDYIIIEVFCQVRNIVKLHCLKH